MTKRTGRPKPGRPRVPIKQRVLPRLVLVASPNTTDPLGRPLVGPCLVWAGATSAGYGVTCDRDKPGGQARVHRLLYEWFVGPIVHELDHLCRVKACASPAHLEDVTPKENRARVPREKKSQQGSTACKAGHLRTPEDTRIMTESTGKTWRTCRICERERGRSLNRRRRANRVERTHCKYGHALTPDNLVGRQETRRRCRKCNQRIVNAWWTKNRSKAARATSS